MEIKQTKLKTYPKILPDDVEVRDFDLGGGRYARVIMEMRKEFISRGEEHFVIHAQAYEMDKHGNFKAAPLGYPSRSPSTAHTIQASDLGRSINMDDSWVQVASDFDPDNPIDGIEVVTKIPTAPAKEYGVSVFHKPSLTMYRWAEGFADIVARTKIEDLQRVLTTSPIHSGFAFRNSANRQEK